MNSTKKIYANCYHWALGAFWCLLPLTTQAQTQDSNAVNYDSLLTDYLYFDSLLLDELTSDSASFFSLLESLGSENYLKSMFTLRAGYSGQVTNAGRTIGINQYGFNAGVSYYHKSGVYADVSGYWNSDQIPNYSTTITDIGYMGNFEPSWSYWASYTHYFYAGSASDSTVYPFTNALNASSNYYIKKFSVGVDYSFTFGIETAHRIRINTGYSFITNKKWWIMDRISFTPNLSMLMGNANVVSWQTNLAKQQELIKRIGWRRYRYLQINEPDKLAAFLTTQVETNTFGVMNYSLFLPLTFTMGKFSLMANYTLNLPVALPGETLDTTVNNYFSTTLLFTF